MPTITLRNCCISTLLPWNENLTECCASYFVPCSLDEGKVVRNWIYNLLDGEMICCRARDRIFPEDPRFQISTTEDLQYQPFEDGIAVKFERQLYFLWQNKVECYDIGVCDFVHQVHFYCEHDISAQEISTIQPPTQSVPSISSTSRKVVVLCHGYSPEHGPKYPLIAVLKHFLINSGWEVVVPDFRNSYPYGTARSRSERVNIILQHIITLISGGNSGAQQQRAKPDTIVLVGHSQGGAAVAQLCAMEAVVRGAHIKGLVLIGAESPVEQLQLHNNTQHIDDAISDIPDAVDVTLNTPDNTVLIHNTCPAALEKENILLIHSNRDRVISALQIKQLAEMWGLPESGLHVLKTHSVAETLDAEHKVYAEWCDDVQHDFIALELLPKVLSILSSLLIKF